MCDPKILNASKQGDQVTTQGWCVYCQQITDWLLTVKEAASETNGGTVNFACQRCKKIERDVSLDSALRN